MVGVRQYIFALLLMLLLPDSRGIPLTTVSCWAPPRSMRGLAHVSHVLPGWDGALHISLVYGWWTSFRNYLVTGSLLFAAPVWSEIVPCLPRVLTEFLRWTVIDTSQRKSEYLVDVQLGVWNRPYLCGWFRRRFSGSGPSLLEFSGVGLYNLNTKVFRTFSAYEPEGHVHSEQSLYSSSNSG